MQGHCNTARPARLRIRGRLEHCAVWECKSSMGCKTTVALCIWQEVQGCVFWGCWSAACWSRVATLHSQLRHSYEHCALQEWSSATCCNITSAVGSRHLETLSVARLCIRRRACLALCCEYTVALHVARTPQCCALSGRCWAAKWWVNVALCVVQEA